MSGLPMFSLCRPAQRCPARNTRPCLQRIELAGLAARHRHACVDGAAHKRLLSLGSWEWRGIVAHRPHDLKKRGCAPRARHGHEPENRTHLELVVSTGSLEEAVEQQVRKARTLLRPRTSGDHGVNQMLNSGYNVHVLTELDFTQRLRSCE